MIKQIRTINHIDNIPVTLDHLLASDGANLPKPGENASFLIFSAKGINGLELYILRSTEQMDAKKAQELDRLLEQKRLFLQKGMLYCQIDQAAPSLIKSLIEQYAEKARDERVKITHWESHFNGILQKAIELKSSDIHIIAREDAASVQLRVHGVLTQIDKYTFSDMQRLISSAYNQMASKTSKDQSFSPNQVHETAIIRTFGGKRYQLRFISRPIYPAGSFLVVMRLLSLSAGDDMLSLEQIGYSKNQIEIITEALAKPSGLMITSGKVGCGKSTTNQTLLSSILSAQNFKIRAYSVEFPVEYVIPGAVQIELKRDQKASTAESERTMINTLDDILRMDPDVLLLGEIRGKAVSNLATQMVQSGHKVLSTVHTQSAMKIINRFLGMGLTRDVLCEPGFFSLLIYQSLIAVPCSKCARTLEDVKTAQGAALKKRLIAEMKRYGLIEKNLANVRLINEAGCKHCTKGIAGRTVVAEVVEPTLELMSTLQSGDDAKAHQVWRKAGGLNYREHALEKILKGQICPISIEQTCGPIGTQDVFAALDKPFLKQVFAKVGFEHA